MLSDFRPPKSRGSGQFTAGPLVPLVRNEPVLTGIAEEVVADAGHHPNVKHGIRVGTPPTAWGFDRRGLPTPYPVSLQGLWISSKIGHQGLSVACQRTD